MKRMPKRLRIMFAIGCLLATSTPALHLLFPAMPDFLMGFGEGIGLGILIWVLIKQKKGNTACATSKL